MCGITGIIDLRGNSSIDPTTLQCMAAAVEHRGPDEDGFLHRPGLGLAHKRLSIVGLADGQQPIFNEDGTIGVVFNGELFDYPEKRANLEALGHTFRTSCDTEILVHLWEEYGQGFVHHLRGQFALALYDHKQRVVVLVRDRLGICPLHWARRGDRLYFGSEVKAILASGEVTAQVDPFGLDSVFSFFAMPGRRTAFSGISQVYPGTFLKIALRPGRTADVSEHTYWDLDFPDRGEEYDPGESQLLSEFDEVFQRAVELRLRADVPVVSYLSGGIDSTTVLSAASRVTGGPIPAFTIKIAARGLDETSRAVLAADLVGSQPTVVNCDSSRIAEAYPALVTATDCPVMDTSCAALYCLAREVRSQGFKVALTGEGADEALAGYPWFKLNRLLNSLDLFGRRGPRLSVMLKRLGQMLNASDIPKDQVWRIGKLIGGPLAQADLYGVVMLSRSMFYHADWKSHLGDYLAYEDLSLNLERLRNWHPLNQSLYLNYKTMLPGLLLNHKGDRPAMHNSVEVRYPFLDEDFVALCAKIHPRYKLRGLTGDKYLLRRYSRRFLPKIITDRPKAMFRAPFANTFFDDPPPYVDQLLSQESLAKTPYFDSKEVTKIRHQYHRMSWMTGRRMVAEMGLAGVMSTQLWHHLFLGGGLCELPTWSPQPIGQVVAPAMQPS